MLTTLVAKYVSHAAPPSLPRRGAAAAGWHTSSTAQQPGYALAELPNHVLIGSSPRCGCICGFRPPPVGAVHAGAPDPAQAGSAANGQWRS